MESFNPSKNRPERILGRTAWRDTLAANECCREIPNLHFPALRSDSLALSGASRRKQIPSSQHFLKLAAIQPADITRIHLRVELAQRMRVRLAGFVGVKETAPFFPSQTDPSVYSPC